ncbi:hypothetical protein EJB05_20472 [Eragrostis curvula]|uniref:B box-type domain-containing protein n=1 Tax=Eragrostis curvula TaxID=38414 RepID=A0A5J9V0B3_9POAL|nr:hypothetical protein EJB05_20472 [Eragrostis curvula]
MRDAPQWLRGLVSEEFFDACAAHPGERKNEKNHYCVDCAAALCRHCLPHHPAHDVIQIWKHANSFVVRVDDLIKLFDCAGIQTHTLSDHEVVFLRERIARKRPANAEINPCAACKRPLPSADDYCSLFCKVKHLGESEQGLRRAIRAAAGEDADVPGKRRASSSEAGPSCGGSFRNRSRKQLEPTRAPFC